MSGNRYCIICGAWLGNYITGEVPEGMSGSYYSIIRRKYCPACNIWKRAADSRFKAREYRKRKKAANAQREKLLRAVIEENKQLRKMLIDKGV